MFPDTTGHFDLHDLLPSDISGHYPYVRDKMLLAAPAGAEVIACADLTNEACLTCVLDRYACQYSGADRRAVASMWTMYYFSMLTIGAALAWLELRRVLPLSLDDVSVCLDPVSGLPRAFVLPDFGARAGSDMTIHDAMAPVLRGHAAPIVSAIGRHERLAPRLLWSNAAAYISWISGEAGRLGGSALAREGSELLEAEYWPDGEPNPLAGMMRTACDENGTDVCRRKVCCLRYALPGVPGCGMMCPLPQGRF